MRHALLAALLVALCLPAGAAARVPRDFFGVMANGPLDAPDFALDAESSAMRSAGVQSERMEIAWDLVEPQKGQYDFALTDRKVLAAARARIDVLALIVRSPAWAARHPGQPFSSPRDPGDYAAFAQALVARYGPRRLAVGRAPRGRRSGPCAPGRCGTSPTSPSTGPSSRSCAATRACSTPPTRRSSRPTPAPRWSWPAWPTSRGATSSGSSPRAARSCASTSPRCTRSAAGPPTRQDRPAQPRGRWTATAPSASRSGSPS